MKNKNLFVTAIAIIGLATATMAQSVPNYVPTSGLVAWYPYSGNANDSSGNGYNGTVSNATLSKDRNGNTNNSYLFVGSSGSLISSNPNLPTGNSNRSISAWFKTTSTTGSKTSGTNSNIIVNWGVGNGVNQSCEIGFLAGQLYFTTYAANILYTTTTISDDKWHNVVLTYDGSSIILYLDGNYLNSMSPDKSYPTFNTKSSSLYIGERHNEITAQKMDGNIDDIGIWNRALSTTEVLNLFTGCKMTTAIITAGGATTFCQGDDVVLSSNLTGSSYKYTWFQNGTAISGATSDNYLANQQGNYTVKIDSSNCSNTSNGITLVVNSLPSVTIKSIPYAINIKENPLTIVGNPSGGTFSGSGMSSNQFYPSSASLGLKKIFYKYTDGNGCTNTAIASTVVYDTTICSISVTDTLIIKVKLSGISPPYNTNTVKIYPNPTKANITVDCGNFTSMNGYSIKINNSIGQTVYNQQITQKLVNINLSGWSGKGTYFVYIIDKQSNVIETKKIILE